MTTEKDFLFYDIETTGLNKSFDQIIQFAAIRTDSDFNEISRHEYFIKLNPDIIPNPYALITHQIPISQIQLGEAEYEVMLKIYNLINSPNTISLGYNTLGFDDEFLRFSFFRNLLPPYNHQFANGCSRADIYPIVIMYYLFCKESLIWPEIDGKVSLKLENINAANKLAPGAAHNAIVDVIVTLELAKKLKRSNPKMWDYVFASFDKETDIQRTSKLDIAFTLENNTFREGIIIDGSFGAAAQYQSVVLSLGNHNHYKNQSLWLRLDANDLHQTTPDNINDTTWVIRKKAGEPGIILPTLERFLVYIDDDRKTLVQKNLKWMNENTELLLNIVDYYRDYTYPKIDNIDPDAALYQMGFLSPYEAKLAEKFHKATVSEKANMINTFQNSILREIAIRILYRLNSTVLNESEKNIFEEYLKTNFSNTGNSSIDYKGQPKYTLDKALFDIEKIQKNNELNEQQMNILKELKNYLLALNNEATI